MEEIYLSEDERLDDLQLDGLKIIQKVDGYSFTSDSVLLANFVKTKKTDICLEIGTGSGIISILVNYKQTPKKIYAFELQSKQSQLAIKNVQICKMQDKIDVINDKVQNYSNYLKAGSIDVIFSNPPYFKYDSKVCGNVNEKVLSRFDKELPLDQMFISVSKMLKYGGKFYFIYDSSRFDECVVEMKKYNLTPKKVFFIHPNGNKNSTTFLCEATLGGKQQLKIMPPIFTNNLKGEYIQTLQKLFRN